MILRHFKILLLLCLPLVCRAGTDCSDLKEGTFRLVSEDGSVHTIVRTSDKQTESVSPNGVITEFNIRWTADCSYVLFNRKVLAGEDPLPANIRLDTLYNEITGKEGNLHHVTASMKGYHLKIAVTLEKVDPASSYRDISELELFKEYDGSAKGRAAIGDNYTVAFKQHSVNETQYLLTFEEALSVDHELRFKMIDHLTFRMAPTQKLALGHCRFNGQYDPEIVAVYTSENEQEEARIIKAWRLNRQTMRLEEVQTNKVQYKEADKNLPRPGK